MKDEIIDFIGLFVPPDLRRKQSRKWANNVLDMFTQGYCYEFAKALKITFGRKYNGRILGTGNMGLYTIHTEKEWRKLSLDIIRNIKTADFLHFMFYAHNRGVYDIYGRYDFDCFETRPLKLFSKKKKEEFITDLKILSLQGFKEKYLMNRFDDVKIIWMCTNEDLKKVELLNKNRKD